jgi:hypothetical protein
MRHPQPAVLVLAAAALLLAACGDATDAPPERGEETEQTMPTDEEDDPAGSELREETEAAIADAVETRGVGEDEIEVVSAESVEWPDGAIGCPEDGEMYTQAIVPGYRVVLDVGGEELHYHGAAGEPPFHCEDPQPPVGD